MKKALMNASVASMIYKFNMNNIDILESLGYKVDVACNFGKENPITKEEIEKFKKELKARNISIIETPCPRNIFSIKNIYHSYIQLKSLASNEHYDIVHTQSPIGGVICRLAFRKARKSGTKVIYQAHGFHFYKGAPLTNWLVFYPIEKFCSRFTDVLITINKEDFNLAKKHFHANKTEYVPGTGIDIDKFKDLKIDAKSKRDELEIPTDSFLILSVGELNKNKNQQIVIKSIKNINNSNVCYMIAGEGTEEDNLKHLINELQLDKQVKMLGYRNDVPELYSIADAYIISSHREGLNNSLMEAMANGLPCISSKIRGNVDLIDNNELLFNPNSIDECIHSINYIIKCHDLKIVGNKLSEKIKSFDTKKINTIMKRIYKNDF